MRQKKVCYFKYNNLEFLLLFSASKVLGLFTSLLFYFFTGSHTSSWRSSSFKPKFAIWKSTPFTDVKSRTPTHLLHPGCRFQFPWLWTLFRNFGSETRTIVSPLGSCCRHRRRQRNRMDHTSDYRYKISVPQLFSLFTHALLLFFQVLLSLLPWSPLPPSSTSEKLLPPTPLPINSPST